MFDIGFTEVTLIAVIGLIVIGPERLPRVAREIGLWVGRLRRYVAQVRADIERDIKAEELRELVNKPAREIKDAIKETEKELGKEVDTSAASSTGSRSAGDAVGAGQKPTSQEPPAAADTGHPTPEPDASPAAEENDAPQHHDETSRAPAKEAG